jgi:FkbM family methyltransferase
MILNNKLKKAVRKLFSKYIILNMSIDELFGLVGESNIKYFVQIGSNDGTKNDLLHRYILKNEWKGILVEPEKKNFKNLMNTYSLTEGLIFENVGIGTEKSEMLFYKVKDVTEQEPGWYDQIGSFNKKVFLMNIEFGKNLSSRISIERLPVISFDDLLQKNSFRKVDLLHTDTEGFDYKILRSIDFGKYEIRMLIFEMKWMTRRELKDIVRYLRGYGYHVFRCGIDYACVMLK